MEAWRVGEQPGRQGQESPAGGGNRARRSRSLEPAVNGTEPPPVRKDQSEGVRRSDGARPSVQNPSGWREGSEAATQPAPRGIQQVSAEGSELFRAAEVVGG